MATLPISVSQIALPYNPTEDENITYLESANNTPQLVRFGGSRVSLTLNIIPISVINDPGEVETISTFLASNPVFSVPLVNFVTTNLSGWTVNGAHTVGDTTIDVNAGTGTPQVGQWIHFGAGLSKCYRIASYAAGTITLAKPLREALSDLTAIGHGDVDGKGTSFDGILCEFINKDFGGPTHYIDGDKVARFGPFRLVESLA